MGGWHRWGFPVERIDSGKYAAGVVDREALGVRTQALMDERSLSWREAWAIACDEVGAPHNTALAPLVPSDAPKRRFWKALSVALGASWVLLYVLPFFVGGEEFWDTWALRLWFVIPPMTVLAVIGLAIRTPSGRRDVPAIVASCLTFLWISVLLAIALHV